MRVVAPSARRSVAPLRRTPVSKSSLCAYPRVLPRLWCISVKNHHPLPPAAHRINPLPWPLCHVNAPGSMHRRHPGLCTLSTPHRQHPRFCASSTPRPLHVVNAPTSAHHQCPGSLPIPLRPVPTLPPGFFQPASGLLCLPLLWWWDRFWSLCPYPRAALHRLWQEE